MNSMLPSGFVKSVLQNGVGRYVCQLQRLVIKFCKSHGCSRGMREFIENDLVDFARNNPGVVVYIKPRRHRTPSLVAEYLNGNKDYINCKNFSKVEVLKHVTYLKDKSGLPIVRLRKYWHTDTPSIQGMWTPFSRIDPAMNLASFPDNSITAPVTELSATEVLKQMARNVKRNQSEKISDSANDLKEN